LVRCEKSFEENSKSGKSGSGVETYIQGIKHGRDDEMVIFFEEADPIALKIESASSYLGRNLELD
jgi:hypothetical protein